MDDKALETMKLLKAWEKDNEGHLLFSDYLEAKGIDTSKFIDHEGLFPELT